MLDKGTCLRYYKREDVQEALVKHAEHKEIGVRLGGGFGKRPDILTYKQDILALAKQGMTSLHCSEENWFNPLDLYTGIGRKEMEGLRSGWDLVLDIDCALFEYSRICAELVVKFLQYQGVRHMSAKFSGNKGFHIGVPFEAFPAEVSGQETRLLFPDAARKIAAYVTEHIKDELGRRIMLLENGDISTVREKVGLSSEEITRYEENEFGDSVAKLKVEGFLEIDTVLISSRHLYRMAYSLHEKSGLVSLPVHVDKVGSFEKPMAHPDKLLDASLAFLDRDVDEPSARRLLISALDFQVKGEEREEEKEYEELEITSPIGQEFFPPCMQHVLKGLEDGKKRALFFIMNYLGKIGWSKKEIEAFVKHWNSKNPEPLREQYIRSQFYSFKAGDKLPPNCNNDAYMKGIGLCHPDKLCSRIKNPVNYTILRWRRWLREKEEEEAKGKKKEKPSEETKVDKEKEETNAT